MEMTVLYASISNEGSDPQHCPHCNNVYPGDYPHVYCEKCRTLLVGEQVD
jgi:hypothetical protein